MARSDKEMSFQERYIKNMGLLKEAYKIRTDFASKFKLKPEKTKGYMVAGDPAAETKAGGQEGSSGGTVVTGDTSGLPTAADYKGPDSASAPNPWSPGKPYRSGMKGMIEKTDQWNAQLVAWGKEFNINPIFMKMVMALESAGDPNLRERGGNGVGLFQITPPNIDTPCDPSRLTDPKYNADIFCKVIHNEKVKQAKSSGSPLTVYEIAWRYNGKSSKGKYYADTVAELCQGVGRSGNESIFFSNPDASSGSTENLGGGPPKAKALSFQVMASPRERIESSSINTGISEAHQQRVANSVYNIPKATIDMFRVRIPSIERKGYVSLRTNEDVFWKKERWRRLDSRFVHLGEPYENFYSPEAAAAFELLLMKLQWNKLEIIKGFDPKAKAYSTHSIGIAMDIRVENMYEAIYLADTAWTCGFRAIAIGGDNLSPTSGGFVHIDCGPKAFWSLGHHDVYKGPGTFQVDW